MQNGNLKKALEQISFGLREIMHLGTIHPSTKPQTPNFRYMVKYPLPIPWQPQYPILQLQNDLIFFFLTMPVPAQLWILVRSLFGDVCKITFSCHFKYTYSNLFRARLLLWNNMHNIQAKVKLKRLKQTAGYMTPHLKGHLQNIRCCQVVLQFGSTSATDSMIVFTCH